MIVMRILNNVAFIINTVAMPARVGIPQRIVARVAVAVQALRVARVGHDGVGLDEAGAARVVISAIVKVQARCRIQPLAGVASVGLPSSSMMMLVEPGWSRNTSL